MASSINASTSGAGGVITTADNTGILNIQTASTTAVTVDASQNVGIGVTTILTPNGRVNTLQVGSNASSGSAELLLGHQGDGFSLITSGGSGTGSFSVMQGTTELATYTYQGVFKFNSGYGSSAIAYGCRAWVNFNGTGTVAIRASGNVSSITDVSAGVYGVNFTTAMPDANYSTATATSNIALTSNYSANTTSIVYVSSMNLSGTRVDDAYMNVAVFR